MKNEKLKRFRSNMDSALALLLPLIGGFLFVKDANFIKYEVAREDGHRFYFRVSYYGLFFFVLSCAFFLGFFWLKKWIPYLVFMQDSLVSIFGPMFKEKANAQAQVNFWCICLFSVFLGRVAPVVVNTLMTKSARAALREAVAKDELEGLLVDAITRKKTILVTLTSDKVYVGRPIGTAEPKSARKAIAILPLMSGNRSSKGTVDFTTHYDEIYGRKNVDPNEFRLVLPADKVLSIAFFDVLVYEQFADRELEKKKVAISRNRRDALLNYCVSAASDLAAVFSSRR